MMKTNTIQFLRNYSDFASQARYQTAQLYLRELLKEDSITFYKRLMMLRIVEEFVAATEDLAMWLEATQRRTSSRFDIWVLMLTTHADEEASKTLIKDIARARTAKGFLKKINFSIPARFYSELEVERTDIDKLASFILKVTKANTSNRSKNTRMLVRFHNKVKHGMMIIYDQSGKNRLFARDCKIKALVTKFTAVSSTFH